MRRLAWIAALSVALLGLSAVPTHLISRTAIGPDFVHFESSHVHPVTLTPSGERLLVVNTPDNRLVVFDLTGASPVRIADIPVGMEPVSVACLDDSTAWVVNHLSDDVSVVNLNTLHTRATVRVGDEPADVVFAAGLAWVSVSQEDVVKSFNPATLAPSGPPIPIGSRMPRALARSADGTQLFVAGFHAGNRTSVLSAAEVADSLPPANPPMSAGLPTAPQVGLIVQQQGADWRDESSKLWNAKIKYTVNDADLSAINTTSRLVTRVTGGLGSVNLGLAAANDGRVALTTTEARNLTRFEVNLRGHLVDTRVAIVDGAGNASLKQLNPHVNYAVPTGTQAERDSAIGIPTGVAWSPDGTRVYVTSLASNKLAVLDPAGGANSVLARVSTVAGPTGVVVDAARGRIYVVGRFRNQLQTLDAATLAPRGTVALGFDPTPDVLVNGRKFFYGGFTSGHGDQACASCHLFGDFDNLAWDLGDPQGSYAPAPPGMIDPLLEGFHPMKGPMTTQTLRGLNGTGLLHWRGDRANLGAFNPAFVSLMGRSAALPDSEMSAFSDFTLALVHPPNPSQLLDRTVPGAPAGRPNAQLGQQFYFNTPVAGPLTCNGCHTAASFSPGTNGQIIDGASLLADQDIKVPQLRNLYRKTGFRDTVGAVSKRGFGFTHDGSTDNLFEFLKFPGFTFGNGPAADAARHNVEAFLLAFDTGMAPAVGAQLTFFGSNNGDATLNARFDTLRAQANAGNCELVAKGRVNGQPRGWFFLGLDQWTSDKAAGGGLTTFALRGLAGPGSEVTITGVPVGSGQRMGLDRDRDGYLDGDELDAHSDPGNPLSTPLNVGVEPGHAREGFALRSVAPNPFRAFTEVRFTLGTDSRVDLEVFDVLGRSVRSVAHGERLAPGEHTLRWDGVDRDGRPSGAGVYFVRLRTGSASVTRAVVRVR